MSTQKSKRVLLLIFSAAYAIGACAESVEETAEESLTEAEDIDVDSRAFSTDTLISCKWEQTALGTTDVTVDCESHQRPISGGCSADPVAPVEDSHPYEASTSNNLPEDSEAWYSTSSTAGWRCKFGATGGSPTHVASVLCCGSS